jgi:DNA polymerase III delta prime subunit
VLDQLWIEEVCEDWEVIAQTSNVPQQHRSKKPAARTDTISIDDIRALQGRLNETSRGRYRCCIIRSVERMQAEAANALLKILEEPPSALVFLFTTQTFSSLLPTIVSRMRVLRFQPLPHEEIIPLLEGVADDDQQFILHIAQGAPGIVQRLKNDPEALRLHRLTHTKAVSFWRSRVLKERLQILEPLAERGEEADQLLLHLSLALREQPLYGQEHVQALHALAAGLKTNAYRPLLAQQFVLSIT